MHGPGDVVEARLELGLVTVDRVTNFQWHLRSKACQKECLRAGPGVALSHRDDVLYLHDKDHVGARDIRARHWLGRVVAQIDTEPGRGEDGGRMWGPPRYRL